MDRDHFKGLGPPPPPPRTFWDVWLGALAAGCGAISLVLYYFARKTSNDGDAMGFFMTMIPFALIGAGFALGGVISTVRRISSGR